MCVDGYPAISQGKYLTPLHTDRYFVFAILLGGWDAILTTDPKDPELYDDDELTVAEYGVETGYGDLGLSSDPQIPMSMGSF